MTSQQNELDQPMPVRATIGPTLTLTLALASPFLYIVKGMYLGQVSSQVSGVVLLSLVCLWDKLVGQKHSITRAGHLRLSSSA
jgi:hypothetical protein